jgi:hypothetical protein
MRSSQAWRNIGASSPQIKFGTRLRDIKIIEAKEHEPILSGMDWDRKMAIAAR